MGPVVAAEHPAVVAALLAEPADPAVAERPVARQAARVASPRAQPARRAAGPAVEHPVERVDPAAQQRKARQPVRPAHPAEQVDPAAEAVREDLEDQDRHRTPAP